MTTELDGGMRVVNRREDIPKFANEADEAAFWSTHELGEGLFRQRGPRHGSAAEKLSKQRFEPHAVYSQDSDVVYVYLRWGRSRKTKELDQARLIDFGEDGTVIGMRFLNASKGLDLHEVPEGERVAELLRDLPLQVRT